MTTRSPATAPPAPTAHAHEVEPADGSPGNGRTPALARRNSFPTDGWEEPIKKSIVLVVSQYVRPVTSPDDAITYLTLYADPREGNRTVDPRVSASVESAAPTN
jgi:hypothetical protein